MALEVSGFSYWLPALVFLLVFIVCYAVLAKLKLTGENKVVHIIVSFIIAIIFLTFTSTRDLVIQSTPWFAVLLILVFFVLLLAGFTQKSLDVIMKPWLAWIVVIIFVIGFLVILLQIFGVGIVDLFYDIGNLFRDYPKVAGMITIIVVGIIAAFIVARK